MLSSFPVVYVFIHDVYKIQFIVTGSIAVKLSSDNSIMLHFFVHINLVCLNLINLYPLVCRYSLKSIDPVLMAPTCVFLASKVEVWLFLWCHIIHFLHSGSQLWISRREFLHLSPLAPPQYVVSTLYLFDLSRNVFALKGIWSSVQHQTDLCSNICV